MRKKKALAKPSSAQGVIACSSYKPRHVHGKRIWLRETSKGDAEKGANSISCSETIAINILSNISSSTIVVRIASYRY